MLPQHLAPFCRRSSPLLLLLTLLLLAAAPPRASEAGADLATPIRNLSIGSNIKLMGDYAYVMAADPAGYGLWRSDGTAAGTTLVKATPPGLYRPTRELISLNSTLYFIAEDSSYRWQLWRSDGTPAGTQALAAICSSECFHRLGLPELQLANGLLFTSGYDAAHGVELWRSDGTATGTYRVSDVSAPAGASESASLMTAGGYAFFGLCYSPGPICSETRSDGTLAGTQAVSFVSAEDQLADVGGALYTIYSAGAQTRLKKINPAASPGDQTATAVSLPLSGVNELMAVGDRLFFSGGSSFSNYRDELWVSDGSAAGTLRLFGDASLSGNTIAESLTDVNGTLFFSGIDASPSSLWRSDGTPAGTVRMLASGGALVSAPASGKASVIDGKLIYYSTQGAAIVQSDGTAAGSRSIQAFTANSSGQAPQGFTLLGEQILFSANGALWALPHSALGAGAQAGVSPGAGGGLTVAEAGRTLSVAVPPGAVGAPLSLIYAPGAAPAPAPANMGFAGSAFSLTGYQAGVAQSSVTFQKPVVLTLTYRDADVAGLDESQLALLVYNPATQTWQDAAATCSPASVQRDLAQNTLTVAICHLSEYAFAGNVQQKAYLPLIRR